MKAQTLQELEDSALVQHDWVLSQEFSAARIQLALGQLEQNSEIRRIRKSRARVKTELRRRELAANLSKGTLVNRHAGSIETSSISGSSSDADSASKGGFFANLRSRFTSSSDD